MILASVIAVPTGIQQAAWIAASQKRVSTTSYVLSRVKWIRLSGLNSFAFKNLNDLRIRELQLSKKYRVLLTWALLCCKWQFLNKPPSVQYSLAAC